MRFVWLATLLLACGDGEGKPNNMIDAPAGPMCTGAVYDPCTTASTSSTECTSGICHNFSGDGITVCSQMCVPGSACPMAGSTAVTCNNMMRCKPPAANNCTR